MTWGESEAPVSGLMVRCIVGFPVVNVISGKYLASDIKGIVVIHRQTVLEGGKGNKKGMSGETSQPTKVRGAPTKYVKLNVGGSLHYTTIGTLTKHDNMLRTMFSGRMEVLTDTDGWILIDRCGKHFGLILNFLRDGSVPLPQNETELCEVYAEAKYYLIEQMVTQCEAALAKQHAHNDPICRVPLITSQKEERLLVKTSVKPIVKLSYNRSNNKYSYTNQSDDNLLKNIELFDKLSLRFNGRILFIKDLIGNNEICCWTYYGNGKKLSEVCCTSIVYATEKKQTKVEFPEARIYEETLNVLLYENRGSGKQPDAELLSATQGAVGARVINENEEEPRRHRASND